MGITSKNIYSPVEGVVIAATTDTCPDGGLGKYIKIQEQATGYYHLFGHLSQWKVKAGNKVAKGTLIGVEGNTGHSFGSHCHYEIRKTNASGSFLDVAQISGISNKIGTYVQQEESEENENMVKRYDKVNELPKTLRPEVQQLIDAGALRGDEKGNLNITEDMARTMIISMRYANGKKQGQS